MCFSTNLTSEMDSLWSSLPKKVYLFIFVAFICQKLFFHDGAGGHVGFTPLEKNAGIFVRDTGAQYFLKG